ncbi:hypothetical protein GCM10017600_59870 [Streptosporangium carneum]|uniref:Uncharacterized protein n=1 Tax=Streptosporangium carneum TaxID=47481 RepID=A0A9W6I6H6_9ACTN|nr:hypothetical protein GCM10017600_59870 [Streptosporangium carneum]
MRPVVQQHPEVGVVVVDGGDQSDAAARYGLVNHHREDQEPSIARLNALVEANLHAAGIDIPRQ